MGVVPFNTHLQQKVHHAKARIVGVLGEMMGGNFQVCVAIEAVYGNKNAPLLHGNGVV